MNLTGLYVQKRIIIYWYIFHNSGFHHICNIKCRLDCRYSPQNIFNAKNFNPHKKPISLLNVPICTQGMQRTWWPEAGTIIVTGPCYLNQCCFQFDPYKQTSIKICIKIFFHENAFESIVCQMLAILFQVQCLTH